ncbi:hypothetical protein NQ314_011195 [Rhamnusium bicolor]|uniref:Uncharacterized protein n=1 Tax=Rhamnusium bicolor TaxID=1586634 RepID=A0AAV8XK33_9CUCU|nr:hypothetical protein NQ314_011195 [Rhamnusium bicolor]
MKQIVFLAVFGFAACGRLDTQYLPPNQRGYSSGTGSGQYSRPSGQYTGTAGQYSRPASQYTRPASQNIRPASQYSSPTSQYSNPTSQYSGSAVREVPILRLEDNNNGDGTYNFLYETGNGIAAQEQGDARGDGTRALGGFSFTAPDGQQVQIQYTADENGFQPQGSHVPQIPEAIKKSIAFNLAEEARGVVDDGQYRAGPSAQYGAPQQYTGRPQYSIPQQSSGQYSAPQSYSSRPQYVAPQKYKPSQNQYIPPVSRGQNGYKY